MSTTTSNHSEEAFRAGDLVRLRAEKWVQNGFTLCHLDSGFPVFLHGALPGEVVEANFTRVTRAHAFARVSSVLEKSSERIDSYCEVFPVCGGCSFRHFSYDSEVALKIRLLAEHKHVAQCIQESEPEVFRGPPDEYRNHVQLQSGPGGIGFFALHSNEVIPFPQSGCRQLSAAMSEAVLRYADEEGRSAPSRPGDRGGRPAVNPSADPRRRLVFRETVEGIFGPEQIEKNILLRAEWEQPSSGGEEPATWRFPSSGFFQVNRFLVPLWLKRIRAWIPPGRPDTVELFCGSGVIGGYCRSALGRYSGYESAGPSVDAAEFSFRESKLNGRFFRNDLYQTPPGFEGVDLVLVNPPRSGLKERLAHALAKSAVRTVIYSSCSPQTMNRDLGILIRGGFRCTGSAVFDFFPRTPHVEVVMRLERSGGSAVRWGRGRGAPGMTGDNE